MAFIDIEGYSFAYPAAQKGRADDRRRDPRRPDRGPWVLRDVNLQVEEGAFCVIVGDTGSGKTTLLRSLKPGLSPVGVREGRVRIAGRAVVEDGFSALGFTARESAAQIGYVMQDPAAQIVCDAVWHELAFGLENLGVAQDEMRRRVAEVAHFFGIEPWVRRGTESLSGGQQQIVNLAAVLALRPRLLLLDEPTAQLDPNALKQFLFLLARVNKELGITVVVADPCARGHGGVRHADGRAGRNVRARRT